MSADNAVSRTGTKSVLAFQNGYKLKKTLCNVLFSGIPEERSILRTA